MKNKYICLMLIGFLALPGIVFAQGKYTKISRPGYSKIPIYSEYYPNLNAKFKGTIIFENGSGNSLTEWTNNRPFLHCANQSGSLFMYDRSGVGKSPGDLSMSISNPMTAKLINSKLMQLLKLRNIKPPYILVAHSYGGMYAGYFARKFPELVKGVLMVDPVPSNYEWSNNYIKQYQPAIKIMNKLSGKELYNQHNYPQDPKYKPLFVPLYYQLLGFKQTKGQLRKLPALSNNIPIIILSSSYMKKNAPIKDDWYEQQKQWLNANPHSKMIQVHSGHYIQLEHPLLVCRQLNAIVYLATR